ncbi:MAG: GH133, partial [uncultured Thermomicrobiales bacterium]
LDAATEPDLRGLIAVPAAGRRRRSHGRRCRQPGIDDQLWPPIPGARGPGLSRHLRWRSGEPGRWLSSGTGLELAHRGIRRRPSPGVCRSDHGVGLAGAVRGPPHGRWTRVDLRNTRRGSPAYASRLYRPGMECGRGPSRLEARRGPL